MAKSNDIEQLFKEHYTRMFHLALQILHNEDTAKDIVHDVFSSLLESKPKYINESYLLLSVRTRSLNHLRDVSIHDRFKEIYAVGESEIEDEEWPDDSKLSRLNEIIDTELTDTCRRVVTLRFKERMTYEEVACNLGISKVAVYKHLKNAINILRKKLTQHG